MIVGSARQPHKLRPTRWWSAFLSLLLLSKLGCGGASGHDRARSQPLVVALELVDGGELITTRYRGKVLVLHLFSTWAIGAETDLEQLKAAATADNVAVLGIALDPDGYPLVAPWREVHKVGYLIAVADAEMRAGHSPLGRIKVVPTTVVLDERGRLARRIEGPLAPHQLQRIIDEVGRTK